MPRVARSVPARPGTGSCAVGERRLVRGPGLRVAWGPARHVVRGRARRLAPPAPWCCTPPADRRRR